MNGLCSVEGCGKAQYHSHGLCRNHHLAVKQYGNVRRERDRTCLTCQTAFRSDRPKAIYCSEVCRFEPFIDRTPGQGPEGDCWEWTGAKHGKGYGHFRPDRPSSAAIDKAHRVAFRLFCDHDPANLMVCHTCDNPSCVNPDHLFLATNTVNMLDRQRKQRQARGERAGNAKLTDDDVRALRNGADHSIIAAKTGASLSTVRHAAVGRHWKHI
jgi:hypothetical protein